MVKTSNLTFVGFFVFHLFVKKWGWGILELV